MTQIMNRRSTMKIMGLGLLLSGCSVTRIASETTITLDVAKVNTYIQAGFNAAETVISVVGVIPSLSIYGSALDTSLRLLRLSASDFNDATKGLLTVRYDSKDIKGSIDTIINVLNEIAETILKVVESEFGLDAKTKTNITLIHSALSTVLALFSMSLIKGNAASNALVYEEHKALKTLNG